MNTNQNIDITTMYSDTKKNFDLMLKSDIHELKDKIKSTASQTFNYNVSNNMKKINIKGFNIVMMTTSLLHAMYCNLKLNEKIQFKPGYGSILDFLNVINKQEFILQFDRKKYELFEYRIFVFCSKLLLFDYMFTFNSFGENIRNSFYYDLLVHPMLLNPKENNTDFLKVINERYLKLFIRHIKKDLSNEYIKPQTSLYLKDCLNYLLQDIDLRKALNTFNQDPASFPLTDLFVFSLFLKSYFCNDLNCTLRLTQEYDKQIKVYLQELETLFHIEIFLGKQINFDVIFHMASTTFFINNSMESLNSAKVLSNNFSSSVINLFDKVILGYYLYLFDLYALKNVSN